MCRIKKAELEKSEFCDFDDFSYKCWMMDENDCCRSKAKSYSSQDHSYETPRRCGEVDCPLGCHGADLQHALDEDREHYKWLLEENPEIQKRLNSGDSAEEIMLEDYTSLNFLRHYAYHKIECDDYLRCNHWTEEN